MRNNLLIVLIISALCAQAQVSSDYAVMLTASYTNTPPSITLHWPAFPTAETYRIYKKDKTETSWGSEIATLDGTAELFTDEDVVIGTAYEYKVERDASSGITAEGYIFSAIELPVADFRGTCLLVIDTTITATLENELTRLMDDISGDGWAVQRLHVARDMDPIVVRDMIISAATADTTIAAAFLLGRVPVLYSGNLYPDGHPDHQGAWPADGIYGDIDAEYTDDFTDITVASRPENWNVPGDGKYDQSIFKSKLELAIGRADMYNMPSFGTDEALLLKRYLDNDHAYRNAITTFTKRALIDDNFGAFGGEAFASSGWRNFAPITGTENTAELDYFTTMRDSSYVWSYGCGGGWYQGSSGVGSTTDFAADTTHAVFTMLFGSYFGDWDVTDNFLRAPLAGGTALTNAWAGRPHWHVHHMALGESIGYSTRLTQNNSSTYINNVFPKWVHIALMGDPTLRMDPVAPVSDLYCQLAAGTDDVVEIYFTPSPDPDVIGYHAYRSDAQYGIYTRITETPVATSPIITTEVTGYGMFDHYMVRPVVLEQTPSGSYFNTGTGVSDSIQIMVQVHNISQVSLQIYPVPADDIVHVRVSGSLTGSAYSINNVLGIHVEAGVFVVPEMAIPVADFPEGMYILHTEAGAKQFMVMHR